MAWLHPLHTSLGASWNEAAPQVPWRYTTLRAELKPLDYGAGLLDFSDHGLIELAGVDRRDFLHNQCTSDIRRMPEQGLLETAFLNPKGQIEHAGVVFNLGPRLWLASASAAALVERFNRYIVFDQVTIQPLAQWGLLRLHGLRSPEIAKALLPEGVEVPNRWAVRATDDLVMGRDEFGLWIAVVAGKLEAVFRQLLDSGATPVGRQAWHTWQVEKGIADIGVAKGELPQEVGWDYRVSYKKGCYMGQEIMARLEARGNTRYQLMGVLGHRPMPSGAPLLREDKKVGEIKTALESPRLGPVALALVRKELISGDQVKVDGHSATIASLPIDLIPGAD